MYLWQRGKWSVKYVLASFFPPTRPARPGIYLCLKGQRHCAGLPALPLPHLLKPAAGYTTRAWEQSSVIHPSIPSPRVRRWWRQAWWMTLPSRDFGRRYCHGTGISMEPPCLSSRAIDWGPRPNAHLLKGPSERRSNSPIRTPGINSDRGLVLNHPDSFPAASVSLLPPLPFSYSQSAG